MIEYFDGLAQEEQEGIAAVIKLLYRQTFLLERKYDKRSGRFQYEKAYRMCSKHMEFLKAYFAVAGVMLKENVHMGVIYIQGEALWGDKLPRLATVYLLILKLIYDEQMAKASTSVQAVTTLGAVNGKAGDFRVLSGIPSLTELRRTVTLLRKYQIIEPLDPLEELGEQTRLVIYPTVYAVLVGDDIKKLLETFSEEEDIGEEAGLSGAFENMPE